MFAFAVWNSSAGSRSISSARWYCNLNGSRSERL